MQNTKPKENFLYRKLKENEIIKPSIYLAYFILLTVILIAISVVLIPPASAEVLGFQDTFEIVGEPFANAFSAGTDTTYGNDGYFNISLERGYNTSGLQVLQQTLGLAPVNPAKRGHYSFPITVRLSNTGSIVGTGTVDLEWIGTVGTYYEAFSATTTFDTWDSTNLTGVSNLFCEYNIAGMQGYHIERGGSQPIIPATTSGLWYSFKSGVSYYAVNYGAYSVVNIYSVNFKNTINVDKNPTTGKVTYLVTKQYPAPITGISRITLTAGNDVVLNNITGNLNINSNTYMAPIGITINELQFGRSMQKVYFDNNYNLSVSANLTAPNVPIIAKTLSSSGAFPFLTGVAYSWNNPITNQGEIFKENFAATNRTMDYILKGSNWYGWDSYFGDYVYDKGPTIPLAVNLYFPNSGTYEISATLYRTNLGFKIIDGPIITVSGAANEGLTTVLAVNGNTGSIISNAAIRVKDLQKNQWLNLTGNPVVIQGSTSSRANIYATAPNYYSATPELGVPLGNQQYTLALYPITAHSDPTNQTKLNVLVIAGLTGDTPLKDAWVGITFANGTVKSDYTNDAGSVSFIVQNNSIITSLASKAGYTSASSINAVSGNSYLVVLNLATGNIIPTHTTIPTPIFTNAGPPITPASWAEGNATTCSGTWDTSSLLEYLKHQAACNGFKTAISQSLLLASIIILLCTGFGAKYGKAIGAAIGAIVGFVLAYALGVIPFMVLALVIVLLVLFAMIVLGLKNG